MSADIDKLKVGQQPSGIDIKKSILPTRPIAPAPVAAPRPLPQPQGPQASLGQAEKTRPFAGMPSRQAPVIPPAPGMSPVTIPPASGHRPSSRLFVLIIVGALLIGGAYWFLSSQNNQEMAEVPSPSVSATSRPTIQPRPKTLLDIFAGTPENIELTATGNPLPGFLTAVNALAVTPMQIKRLSITSSLKGSPELGVMDLLNRLLVSYPLTLKNSLASESMALAYGQSETFDSKGQPTTGTAQKRLALVLEVKDPVAITSILSGWESTMPDALAGIFAFDKKKAASKTFLSNVFQGVSIRYKNFPYADRTVDYTLVPAGNGKAYLVVTNSREATYQIIQKLKESSIQASASPSLSNSPQPSLETSP